LRADHREPDAGVAAGRLDHRLARLEHAGALGRLNHVERETVLDRRCGVEEFGFDIDCPALNSEIVNPDRWSVADRLEDTVEKAATAQRASDGCCSRHNRLLSDRHTSGTMPDAAA
jgi:hypothetical protein